MPVRDVQFYLAPEATAGTEETVAAGEVICIEQGSGIFEAQGDPIQRALVRPHMDVEVPVAPPAQFWRVPIEMEMKASTGATTAPEWGNMLESGGFVETVGGADVTYALSDFPNGSTDLQSCTLRSEEAPAGDGNVYVAIGSRIGEIEFRGGLTDRVMVTGTGVGQYKTPVDLGSLSSATYDAGVPLAKLSSSGNPFQFHSYDMIVRNWTIAVNLGAEPRGSMKDRASFGYLYPAYLLRTGAVSFTFEIELVDQTAFGLWALYDAATAAAGSIVHEAGSRTCTWTVRNTVFGVPSIQQGPPKMLSLSGTAHRSGSDGALDVVTA